MPNAWDVGSARILESLGFSAIATTSGGFAASLGRMDQEVTLDEVVAHVRSLTEAVGIPLSVDAENCYSETDDGIRETVDRLADAGAAGFSIEDYSPAFGIYPLEAALSRVAVAVEAAQSHGLVVTARAENYLYDIDDLEDTTPATDRVPGGRRRCRLCASPHRPRSVSTNRGGNRGTGERAARPHRADGG